MLISRFLKRFDGANLRLRVVSGLVLAPLFLGAVYLGGWVYNAFIIAIVTLGLYEWLRLVAPRTRIVGAACAGILVVMMSGAAVSASFGAMVAVAVTLALFLISARAQDNQAGWIALGIPYMGGSGLALLDLRATPDSGAGLMFFLLFTVWGTDVGAFIAGRVIGGAKLAPAISPSKTWSGLFGGMALAVIMGYVMASTLGARHPPVALILSPALAVVAQLGDLFESSFKRRSGVKDSGGLIPGHGGVLDRIDGLAFAAFFMALFQTALGRQMNWW